MKALYCWRCRCVVPMMDEAEYRVASDLYAEGARNFRRKGLETRQDKFRSLLDHWRTISGLDYTNPNAILHHRLALYGPPCEACGKPYRTPRAVFCAACGHRRPNFQR